VLERNQSVREPLGATLITGLRKVALGLFSILLVVLLAGASYQFFSNRRDLRLHPPPGQMIDIGGYRLHLYCTGQGLPTVVFDSGLSDDSITWYKVQPEIAKVTRSCSYDRAGLGWSDPSPLPRTSRVVAEELHRLLKSAKIEGPFILVGHSLGGLNIRMFAALYPRDTAGMVLVDSAYPDQYKRLPVEVQSYNEKFLRRLGYFEDTMLFGWPRLSGWCDQWPAEIRAVRRATECRLQPWLTHLAEYRAFDESSAQILATKSLGDIPLVVLSHDTSEPGPMATAWSQMQKDLTSLSSRSSYVVVPGSTHTIQVDHPQAVIDAIHEEIAELR
jgi:pimeloyl-ACP methyl ester carboxylesterase